MPSCLSWKLFTKKHKANKRNTDYVYLQWHFMTSQQGEDTTQVSTEARTEVRTEDYQPAVRDLSRVQTTEERKNADIQSWLESLPDSVCTEIYCDCCDAEIYSQLQSSPSSSPSTIIYSNTSSSCTPSVAPRRQDSISSMTSSSCSCAQCLQSSEESDDESLYSLQLRRKSRDIFLS